MAEWFTAKLIVLFAQLGPVGRRAQSMVEYSIIAALIAIVALTAVSGLGTNIAGVFGKIASSVSGLGGPP